MLLKEDIDLRLQLDPDLLPLNCDATQMEQVIMNLAVNAGDAMPTGGVLEIAASNCELPQDQIELSSTLRGGEIYTPLSQRHRDGDGR